MNLLIYVVLSIICQKMRIWYNAEIFLSLGVVRENRKTILFFLRHGFLIEVPTGGGSGRPAL